MDTAILEIKDLSFAYDKINVLEQVSFDGYPGEVLVLAGPNGSGKTTMIKLLFDLLEKKQGDIRVFEKPHAELDQKKRMYYRSSENVLPQFLTGDEYVRMMCRLYDVDVDEELYASLIQYYAMESRMDHLIENYSHGMVKKIQLITAFLLQLDITVVDETLNGIDIEAKEVSKVLLRKLVEKNKLVVMCTHDLELAEQIGDSAILLYKGAIQETVNLKEQKRSLTDIFKELIGFKETDYAI